MSHPQPTVLEDSVPLSHSVIWRLQRDFYIQRGLKAWTEDMVPQFITNNPLIAEIYARIVFAFLADCSDLSPANPLRILELGAGVGKFSYLFLRQLTAFLRSSGMVTETVRYCMTDCPESLIESWRANSYLAGFVECGMLEFERFQIGEELHSQFLRRKGPLVVIANYVFDSLPQDAFVIRDGQISEVLLTTTAPDQSGEGGAALSRLQLSYKNNPILKNHYPVASWNHILEQYRNRFSSATILFPCAALKTLQELATFANGRLLVLAADKGFVYEEEVALCQGPLALEFHSTNCFSQMVNLDAISKYFQAVGGATLLPDKHFSSLSICAFHQGRFGNEFAATKKAYREAQAAVDPDDVFTLFAWLNAHMEEMTVPQILSALKLTRWDPVALLRLFPVLGRQLRNVGAERHDVRNAVMSTWANHYPVTQNENLLAFDCGVILLELRFFDDAFSMFKISQQIFGPSATTSYNLGLCALGLGRSSEALAFMVEAGELDSAFEPARQMRFKLEDQKAPDKGA